MTIFELAAITQITATFVVLFLLVFLSIWGLRTAIRMQKNLWIKDEALSLALTTLKSVRACLVFTGPADEDELRLIVERVERGFRL